MAQKPSIPKGTRDFSPVEIARRNYIFDTIRQVFSLFGYRPIETPSMENLSTLMGKYGDEGDKLLFKVLNSGDWLSALTAEDTESGNAAALTKKVSEKGLRFDHVDPLATNYHPLSPYIYCASNPVNATDLTGCEFVHTSDSLVNKYSNYINFQIRAINESTLSYDIKKAATDFFKVKLKEIDMLNKSTQKYQIKYGEEGETYYDVSEDMVVAVVPHNNEGPLLNHEFAHLLQFERGQISFNENGKAGILYDQTDEIEAINNERLFYYGFVGMSAQKSIGQDGESMNLNSNSNLQNVANGFYYSLPKEKRSLNRKYRKIMIRENAQGVIRHYFFGWRNSTK